MAVLLPQFSLVTALLHEYWIEESVLAVWIGQDLSGKPGASIFYSDLAIMTMMTLKSIYALAGRQCQGCVESIFDLMDIELSVPDHSTGNFRESRGLARALTKDRQGAIEDFQAFISMDG
jgi:Transposase DDE domain